MDDKFKCDVSEEEDHEAWEVDNFVGKSEPPISNARKYLMSLDVENKMMAALRCIENNYTLFCTKVKKQQTSLFDSDLY